MMGIALVASLAPPAGAAELEYGKAGVPSKLPDLGPAGNGRRLFLKLNCYLCHGGNAGGGTGPNIQGANIDAVYEATQEGEPYSGMPSFKKWTTFADVQNLTAYLGSIGTKSEPTWYDWWVAHPKQ
jgi:mono/diheme cytochrome c family protein